MTGDRRTVAKPSNASLLRDRDPTDPLWQAVELSQRGRMILDVTAADLEASEAANGPFHATTWHFRNAWYEAQRSWDRLRAQIGGATLEAALDEPPLTVLAIGPGSGEYAPDRAGRWPMPEPGSGSKAPVLLIPIGGRTYRADRVAGTSIAQRIWRLNRLHPPLDDGPYYACRLGDGSTQCDCAEWIYQLADTSPHALCKHLAALAALRWI